ncbi:MAG TPA: FKBP-type peptidyl-prolyl cis-trans isomerase [Cytophagaceae bacterium]|nr:FKBP-type peptidyl-prolyl cis-trans isomerase [Cytophagaceae bacterium]
MNVKNPIIFAALAFTLLLSSCKEYKSDDGIQYKIIVDSAGPVVELGGVAFINMTYYNEKDTFDSKKAYRGQPFPIRIPDSIIEKSSLERGLRMLSKGDSASFIISTDSLYKGVPRDKMPVEIKPGSMTTFFIRVVSVLSRDSVKVLEKKRQDQMVAAELQRQVQAQMDTVTILDYIKVHKLKAKRTPDGVYYVVTKAIEGITLQPGDTAKTFYTGKLLDGTTFDSNVGKEPFTLVVGMGQVIRGWDSGLMALKKGEKATLLIPSNLAYGERGAGGSIPPNAILLFDLEVLK